MKPVPLYVRVTYGGLRDDVDGDDALEHEVLLRVIGDRAASVEGTVVSDFCQRPRVEDVTYDGLGLPPDEAEALLLAAWQSLVFEMMGQSGTEIEWKTPDARPWLRGELPADVAEVVIEALGNRVPADAPSVRAVLSTTIG
jgi:hypothetical protein